MAERLVKQLIFPTALDPGGKEYKPQPAHDEATIEERRGDPRGTLLFAAQYIGAMTAKLYIEKYSGDITLKDAEYGDSIVTTAALESARYSLAYDEKVAFRRIKLPMLFDLETGQALTTKERSAKTREALGNMVSRSGAIYNHMKNRRLRAAIASSHAFGYEAGRAALWVALLAHPEIGQSSSAALVQKEVRDVGLAALQTNIEFADVLGTKLSLAMLGEKNTDLTTHLHASTHHGTLHAFKAARKEAIAIFEAA